MDTGGHRLDPDDLLGASAVRAAVDALMLRSREHVAQMDADQVEAATAQCRGAALDVLAAVRAAIGSPAGEDEPRGRAVVVIEDDGGREVHFHAAFHPQLEESGEDGAFLGTAAQAAAVRMLSQMATEDAGGNAPA